MLVESFEAFTFSATSEYPSYQLATYGTARKELKGLVAAAVKPFCKVDVRFGSKANICNAKCHVWFPSILKVLSIIRPETLVRWHRAGFRRYWRWKSHARGGRPQIDTNLRERPLFAQIDTRLLGPGWCWFAWPFSFDQPPQDSRDLPIRGQDANLVTGIFFGAMEACIDVPPVAETSNRNGDGSENKRCGEKIEVRRKKPDDPPPIPITKNHERIAENTMRIVRRKINRTIRINRINRINTAKRMPISNTASAVKFG